MAGSHLTGGGNLRLSPPHLAACRRDDHLLSPPDRVRAVGKGRDPRKGRLPVGQRFVRGCPFYQVDFLALGMLSLVEECVGLIAAGRPGEPPIDLSRIPFDDPAVYDEISAGDTVGVFQIESRAQIQLLPRTQPRTWIAGDRDRDHPSWAHRRRSGSPVCRAARRSKAGAGGGKEYSPHTIIPCWSRRSGDAGRHPLSRSGDPGGRRPGGLYARAG